MSDRLVVVAEAVAGAKMMARAAAAMAIFVVKFVIVISFKCVRSQQQNGELRSV